MDKTLSDMAADMLADCDNQKLIELLWRKIEEQSAQLDWHYEMLIELTKEIERLKGAGIRSSRWPAQRPQRAARKPARKPQRAARKRASGLEG
jgi:hypothetical protein